MLSGLWTAARTAAMDTRYSPFRPPSCLADAATSPESGVVDSRNRLFGYRNLYVRDGSVIAANLGVNPSLTICALTERAMSFIPPAPEAEWH
jgi:cholesterol oxidase